MSSSESNNGGYQPERPGQLRLPGTGFIPNPFSTQPQSEAEEHRMAADAAMGYYQMQMQQAALQAQLIQPYQAPPPPII